MQFSSAKCIHIVMQPIPGTLSSCKTKTLYPLDNNSSVIPSPSKANVLLKPGHPKLIAARHACQHIKEQTPSFRGSRGTILVVKTEKNPLLCSVSIHGLYLLRQINKKVMYILIYTYIYILMYTLMPGLRLTILWLP